MATKTREKKSYDWLVTGKKINEPSPEKKEDTTDRFADMEAVEIIAQDLDEWFFSFPRVLETFWGNTEGLSRERVLDLLAPDRKENSEERSRLRHEIEALLPPEKKRLALDLDTAVSNTWMEDVQYNTALAFAFGMKVVGASMEEIRKQAKVWRVW